MADVTIPEAEQPSADLAHTYAFDAHWFDGEIPEFFTDTVNLQINAYGASVVFGTRSLRGPSPKARVYMSHEMAEVLSRLLRRVLRSYEQENAVAVQVPTKVLAELKILESDLAALEIRGGIADDGSNDENA